MYDKDTLTLPGKIWQKMQLRIRGYFASRQNIYYTVLVHLSRTSYEHQNFKFIDADGSLIFFNVKIL